MKTPNAGPAQVELNIPMGNLHGADIPDAPVRRLWVWINERESPPASVGALSTVASCEPGDLVVAEFEGLAWALIAFRVNAGFDAGDAFAYVGGASGVRQHVTTLRVLPSATRVRFAGVRPAFKR